MHYVFLIFYWYYFSFLRVLLSSFSNKQGYCLECSLLTFKLYFYFCNSLHVVSLFLIFLISDVLENLICCLLLLLSFTYGVLLSYIIGFFCFCCECILHITLGYLEGIFHLISHNSIIILRASLGHTFHLVRICVFFTCNPRSAINIRPSYVVLLCLRFSSPSLRTPGNF